MAVSRVGHDKTPQSLATPAFAGFPPVAENGTKAVLTTGMTTDRKNFIFTVRRGIMAEIEYPGVVQLIERVVWDHEAESLSLSTRTKIPLKSLISEGFFLFFVYCGADDDITPMLLYANTRHTQKYFIAIMPKLRYDTNIKNVELPRLQGIIWAKYYRFPY